MEGEPMLKARQKTQNLDKRWYDGQVEAHRAPVVAKDQDYSGDGDQGDPPPPLPLPSPVTPYPPRAHQVIRATAFLLHSSIYIGICQGLSPLEIGDLESVVSPRGSPQLGG
jgi:hypothetical protein